MVINQIASSAGGQNMAQYATGSFSLSKASSCTINCGFTPDIVLLMGNYSTPSNINSENYIQLVNYYKAKSANYAQGFGIGYEQPYGVPGTPNALWHGIQGSASTSTNGITLSSFSLQGSGYGTPVFNGTYTWYAFKFE